MSVKNTTQVADYVKNVAEIKAAIESLKAFAESLPTPENGELPTLHYGHTGTVSLILQRIVTVNLIAQQFYGSNKY